MVLLKMLLNIVLSEYAHSLHELTGIYVNKNNWMMIFLEKSKKCERISSFYKNF